MASANRAASDRASSVSAQPEVRLDQQRCHAEGFTTGADAAVGGDPRLEEGHHLAEFAAAQRAERRRDRLMGRVGGGAGPVGQLARPGQRPRGVVVQPASGRLPGQHLHRDRPVGGVAEVLCKFRGLTGVREGARVVAQPGPAGGQDRQAWDEDADRPASAYLLEPGGTDCHGVTHLSGEACGQRHQHQGPRIVTQRGQVRQPSDLIEPGHARLEVTRQQECCATAEGGHQPLLGVVGIGDGVDPTTAVGHPGNVVETEPRERKLGQVTDQGGSLEEVRRLVEVLDGLRHRSGVLLQHPEREQGLAAGPVLHPLGQYPVDQATDPGDVAGLEGVVGGEGESLPRQVRVGCQLGGAFERRRGGGEAQPVTVAPRERRELVCEPGISGPRRTLPGARPGSGHSRAAPPRAPRGLRAARQESPARARCCAEGDAGSGTPPAPRRGRRADKPPAAPHRR